MGRLLQIMSWKISALDYQENRIPPLHCWTKRSAQRCKFPVGVLLRSDVRDTLSLPPSLRSRIPMPCCFDRGRAAEGRYTTSNGFACARFEFLLRQFHIDKTAPKENDLSLTFHSPHRLVSFPNSIQFCTASRIFETLLSNVSNMSPSTERINFCAFSTEGFRKR